MLKVDCVINKNEIAGGCGKIQRLPVNISKQEWNTPRKSQRCNLRLGRFKEHDQTDLCLNWGLNTPQTDQKGVLNHVSFSFWGKDGMHMCFVNYPWTSHIFDWLSWPNKHPYFWDCCSTFTHLKRFVILLEFWGLLEG